MSESNSRTIRTVLFFLLVSIVIAPPVSTEPRPGDLFREYGYLKYLPKSQGLWRIGYKWNSINGKVIDVGDIDLGKATRAEACIEKVLCHDRTRGLAIKFNGNTWHPFPEAAQINSPQWEY